VRTWAPRVLWLALAVQGALPAPAGAFSSAQAEEKAPAATKKPSRARGDGPALDARVAQLTKALGLDDAQQAELRKALEDQRTQVERIWSDGSVPSRIRIAETRDVSKHTADRVRAMLNDEQRKKFDPPPQDGAGGTTGKVDVEEWMSGRRTR
jgi:hypothetical protein